MIHESVSGTQLICLNEVFNLPFSGPQEYSCIVMEITVLKNHNTVVTYLSRMTIRMILMDLALWTTCLPLRASVLVLLVCSQLVNSHRAGFGEMIYSSYPVRLWGTAGIQDTTDWNIHCYCFFWLGVPSFVLCIHILLAHLDDIL